MMGDNASIPSNAIETQKAAQMHGLITFEVQIRLLDLAFFVFDVLAHNRVILLHDHLFGHGPCVFLRHVKMPSPRGGVQADFDGGRLRHGASLRVRGANACG